MTFPLKASALVDSWPCIKMLPISYFAKCSCWSLTIWTFLVLKIVQGASHFSDVDACPREWVSYDKSCYSFISHRPSSWQDSLNICNASSFAHLVSVNSVEEGAFLAKWLEENDFRRKSWWTSGYLINERWEWAGDGSRISFYAKGARLTNSSGTRIAYIWRNDEFLWTGRSEKTLLAFICELPKSKIFLYHSDKPDLDYGLRGVEAIRYNYGPKITMQPSDFVTYANGPRHSVELPCKAESYPSPTYRWIKASTGQEITPADSTYVIVDGTLVIRNVTGKDFGAFFCLASNGAAAVRSRSASFSSSYVKEFPKSRLDVYATEGTGKSIPCEAPSHFPQSLSFAWMYDTVKNFLHETNRIFISSDGTLHFSYLTRADQKNYACSIVIPELHTGYYGPFFSLKVDPPPAQAGPPSASSTSKPVIPDGFLHVYPNEPRLGAAAWIECFAYARPAPIYRWVRIDRPLNAHVVVRNFGRRLYFPHLQMNDSGTYRCTAENGEGAASKEINLVLQIPPRLVSPLSDTVVEVGGTVTFVCDVFGVPRLDYEWFHNGKPVNPLLMAQEDQGRISIDGNRLTVGIVQERDAGVYQCYASNSVGQTGTSAELVVRNVRPTFVKQRPDRTVYAVAGSSARLPCRVESLPVRKATTWVHDNLVLTPRDGVRLSRSGDLVIETVNFSHSGRYTCTVENELGLDSTSLMLTVLPQLSVSVQAKPSEHSKDSTDIDCLVNWESDKYMDVARKWTFNCHDIDTLDQFRVLNGSASSVSNLQRITNRSSRYLDGVLMCRADTAAGHASASMKIEAKRAPMTPVKVMAHNVSLNGVHMSWELPSAAAGGAGSASNGEAGGTIFKVEARLSGTDVWKHLQIVHPKDAISRNVYLITAPLLPNCRYQFRVFAQNRLGRGAASVPTSYIRTLPGPPAKAVTNLRATVLVPGEILVQWKPLQKVEWGSGMVGYFLEWQYSNLTSSSVVKSSVTLRSTDVDHYVILTGDVKFCIRHKIHLSAFNEYGWGPVVSTSAEALVLAAPYSQPSNVSVEVLNSSAVSIKWNRPTSLGDQPCQKWTGMKLFYWTANESPGHYSPSKAFPLLKYASVNQSEIVLADLTSSTEYILQLAFFNLDGDGPQSPELTATTHRRGPRWSPSSVSVSDDVMDGRTVAVVRWNEIDFQEARVFGYKVHLFKTPWTVPHVIKVEARNSVDWQPVLELDGLKSFQEYKLCICAFTEGGDGPFSEPVFFYLGSQSRSWSLRSRTCSLYLCILVLVLFWKHLRGA